MREAIAGFLASSLIFFFGQSTASAQSTVTIRVDAAANRRPINPNIYGVAHATTAQLNELNAPLHRNGGNNTTRHNWQLNADNRGNDWYYQSIPDNSATAGERGDSFITNSRAAGAGAMLTVPLIEWVAKVGPGRTKLASFSIASTARRPATTGSGFRMPETESGRTASSSPATIRTTPAFRRPPRSSADGSSTWSTGGARTQTAACATTSSITNPVCGTRRTATSGRRA
jgi:Glycoside hydrolase family 44